MIILPQQIVNVNMDLSLKLSKKHYLLVLKSILFLTFLQQFNFKKIHNLILI